MDIHRARFVPYPTSAINALAFSHSNTAEIAADDISNLRLALGRANGDIEIWNPYGTVWVQETIFHGGRSRSIEGLVWTQNPPEQNDDGKLVAGALRLFSIGCSNTVTEWDLESGLPLRHWSASQSEVWCLSAQPRIVEKKSNDSAANWIGQNIVAGCADGSIVVLSTADDDFTFLRFLARPTSKRARVLSLAFQGRNTVVAGYADSTIRLFDLQKGNLIRNISLGAAPRGGPKDILVWSVKCLANGDIVSGDSTGEVRFFERKHFSQTQRLASHDADILDLAVSKETNTVFSAGMDRRTSSYFATSSDSRWAKRGHESYHEHDVKVMSTYEGKNLNIIASGGLDTNLVIIPMRSHKKELHYTISGLRQHPPMDGCAARSLFVCWWERELSIWKLSKSNDHKKHRLLARIALKGEENISYASISNSGSLLATVTIAELKLFSLKPEQDGSKESLTVQKLVSTSEVSSKMVEFSPDEKWIAVVTHANTVEVINTNEFIQRGNFLGRRELRRLKRDSASDGPLGLYKRTINRITFSPDSAMLVVSDISGYMDSWVLLEDTKPVKVNGTTNHNHDSSDSEESDSEESDVESQVDGPRWKINPSTTKLPKLDSQPLVLSFRRHWPGAIDVESSSSTPYDLLVLTSQHHLWELDMISGSLTEWSRKNPTSSLPDEFRALLDRAMGSFWGSDGWWWIYGSSWLFGINVTVDHIRGGTEATSNSVIEATNNNKKRKRGTDGAGGKTKKDSLEGLVALADESDTETQINGTVSSDKMDIDQEDEEEDFGTTLIGGLRGGDIGKEEDDDVRPKWFMALKYRPILGIVPVGQENGKPVEVVLVERPIWDLNLPPRFEKIQDR